MRVAVRAVLPLAVALCAGSGAMAQCQWLPGAAIPGAGNSINDIVIFDADGEGPEPARLIAVGTFVAAGDSLASYIAAWDGTGWRPLGTGLDGVGEALHVHDGRLIVGERFAHAGGVPAPGVAAWDGATWQAIGTGVSGTVLSLASFNGDLLAGGDLDLPSNIVRFDGTAWIPIAGAPTRAVGAMIPYNGELFVGDTLISRWDGTTWRAATGAAGTAYDLRVFEGQLYAATNAISRWNGSSFTSIGTANSRVEGLAFHNGTLYAGGAFTSIAGPLWRFATPTSTATPRPIRRISSTSSLLFSPWPPPRISMQTEQSTSRMSSSSSRPSSTPAPRSPAQPHRLWMPCSF